MISSRPVPLLTWESTLPRQLVSRQLSFQESVDLFLRSKAAKEKGPLLILKVSAEILKLQLNKSAGGFYWENFRN